MDLHTGFIAEYPVYLCLTQPPLLIAFQGNLFEDMTRDIIPRLPCRHIIRHMYGYFHSNLLH